MKINIDGIPQPVTVDDAFSSLAPEQQQATLQGILQQYHGGSQPAPSGSLLNAAGQSLIHGFPAAVASGVAGVDRYLDNELSGVLPADPQGTRAKNNDATDAWAAQQRLQMAQNYKRPDTVAPSVAAGFAEGQGLGGKLLAAGKAALYGTAENAGPIAAGIVGAPLAAGAVAAGGPIAAGIGAAGLGVDGLLALSGVRDAKARAGMDPNQVTTTDMLNAGAQTALNSAAPAGSGMLLRTALGASKGALAPVMSDAGALAQGGNFAPGQGLAGNLAQVGNDALEGGTQGGLLAGGHAAVGLGLKTAGDATLGLVRAITDPSKAGQGAQALSDYQAAVPKWNDAVTQAKQAIGPQPAWVDTQAMAEAKAVADGAVKPDATPEVQNAAARLAALQLFQARKASEDQRDSTGKADANTFKGVTDDLKFGLTRLANGLRDNDLISKDDHGSITAAIAEAAKHNRNLAEDGATNGYMPTALDMVKGIQLDPALANVLQGGLRTLDYVSSNGLINRTKGPLEQHAGTVATLGGALMGTLAGGVTGGLFHGLEDGLVGLAGMGSQQGQLLAKGLGTSWAKQLDQMMGLNKPQALQNSDAFLRFAQARGLNPAVTADGMTDALGHLAALSNLPKGGVAPQGPPVPAGAPSVPPAPTAPQMPQRPPQAPPGPPPQPPALPPAPSAPPAAPPAAPAAPQMPTTPPPGGADPLAAMRMLAQAQEAAKQTQTQAAVAKLQQLAPSDRKGWSAAMANTLGVQHGPMMDMVKGLIGEDGDLQGYLQKSTVPREIMEQLTNHLADQRDAGKLPLATAPAAGSSAAGAGIRNPQAYQAAIDQEAAAGNALRPQYAAAVATIQAQKTVKAREAALETLSAAVTDPLARARMRADLKPLTQFGSRADDTPSEKASD